MCACGAPLHYSNPELRAVIERLIAKLGECLTVSNGEHAWMVPRHYIALHGLKGSEIATLAEKYQWVQVR